MAMQCLTNVANTLAAWESQTEGDMREVVSTAQSLRRLRGGPSVSKLDADLDMRAYALARIHAMSYVQLAEAMAIEFGSDRAPSKSSIGRWWQKQRNDLAAQDMQQPVNPG